MEHTPRVSVVVRTRDRRSALAEALASIEAQSHRPIEVVVVNDGGAAVNDIVRSTLREAQAHIIDHDTPKGRAAAANAGVEAASGALLAFLDDDDLFLSHHLETLVKVLRDTGATLAYAGCRVEQAGGSAVMAVPFDMDTLALSNYIPTCGVLVARQAVLETGGFDCSLAYLEDWDLWLRIAATSRIAFTPTVTSVYRAGPTSVGGAMADERWQAMESLLRKHWDLVTPQRLVRRLCRLERDIAGLREIEKQRGLAIVKLNDEIELRRKENAEVHHTNIALNRRLTELLGWPRWRRWLEIGRDRGPR